MGQRGVLFEVMSVWEACALKDIPVLAQRNRALKGAA